MEQTREGVMHQDVLSMGVWSAITLALAAWSLIERRRTGIQWNGQLIAIFGIAFLLLPGDFVWYSRLLFLPTAAAFLIPAFFPSWFPQPER